jgi:hypothetical protein
MHRSAATCGIWAIFAGAAHAVVAGLVLVGQMKRIDSAAALVNVYFSEA